MWYRVARKNGVASSLLLCRARNELELKVTTGRIEEGARNGRSRAGRKSAKGVCGRCKMGRESGWVCLGWGDGDDEQVKEGIAGSGCWILGASVVVSWTRVGEANKSLRHGGMRSPSHGSVQAWLADGLVECGLVERRVRRYAANA